MELTSTEFNNLSIDDLYHYVRSKDYTDKIKRYVYAAFVDKLYQNRSTDKLYEDRSTDNLYEDRSTDKVYGVDFIGYYLRYVVDKGDKEMIIELKNILKKHATTSIHRSFYQFYLRSTDSKMNISTV